MSALTEYKVVGYLSGEGVLLSRAQVSQNWALYFAEDVCYKYAVDSLMKLGFFRYRIIVPSDCDEDDMSRGHAYLE